MIILTKVDSSFKICLVEEDIRDLSHKVRRMVKADYSSKMEVTTKVNGKITKCMDLASYITRTDR